MSIVRRFLGSNERHQWEGVEPEPYSPGDPRAGTRQVLIGPEDGAANFALRYFELAAGTASRMERHAHDHGVYILNGRGRVRLGVDEHRLAPGDVVYVQPHGSHVFEADADSPLGFLCIVPARRGR